MNLLKYALTSHEPLTNSILATNSKSNNKGIPPNQFASAVSVMPGSSNRIKMDIKVLQSKFQEKIIVAEADGDFVDFIFSFLTMLLGSVVKLLGPNSFAGCVGNLYKSVENLDRMSVLLDPGIAHQFSCLNQPLNIPEVQPTTYYYGIGTRKNEYSRSLHCYIEGGVISKSQGSIYKAKSLIAMDPRSLNGSKDDVTGFVKRAALYGIGDDLRVKPLSSNYFLSYLNELALPLIKLEVTVISIGETEVMWLLFITKYFCFVILPSLIHFNCCVGFELPSSILDIKIYLGKWS